MKHICLALAIWGSTLFWGLGLAWLATPRRWKRLWPVFIPVAGWSLQSAAVWLGTLLNLPGTDSYALWSLGLPALLLVWALLKRRCGLAVDFARFWPLWTLSLAVLCLLVLPVARSSRPLTTISLGSCDAADYAAGARVLKEYSRSDRSGFIGNTEVVQLRSVNNFYDHWLRLNHFSPSALMAQHCSVLKCQPEHLISLFTASLLSLSLPLVFLLSRSLLRLGRWSSLGIAAFYGLNSLTWYAVFHVAPGQLLAAQAIAVITWAGIVWWRGAAGGAKDLFRYGLLLLLAYSLILGSYNFIVVVCLVPAVAYACLRLLRTREPERVLPWLTALLAPLILAMILFLERTRGLAERFLLFQQFDFGWRIPSLSPEGWLGMVSDVNLRGHEPLFRWVLSVMLLAWLTVALVSEWKRRSERSAIALSLGLPVLAGYLFLVARGALSNTNASYDAYKLLSVFLPGLLPALLLGTLDFAEASWKRWLAASFALVIAILNGSVLVQYVQRMSNPPLRVDAALTDLRKVDAMTGVASVNMLIPDFWDRLWANAFLLRKKQYFESYTYEGRRNTALKGEWNLQGGLVRIIPANAGDFIPINSYFSLVRAQAANLLRVRIGDGWYDRERHLATRWRWSKGNASILLENPRRAGLKLKGTIKVRSLVERDLQFWIGKTLIHTVHLGLKQASYEIPEFVVSQRIAKLELRSPTPPSHNAPNDGRPLGVCLYGLELKIQ